MFSFDPRCHGLCGSQKYTGTSVSMVNSRCWDISLPDPQVNERRRCAGNVNTVLVRGITDGLGGVISRQVQQHHVPGRPLDQGADRAAVALAGDESGSPDALLRRGPLRTVRAAFTAHGSSKPMAFAGCCSAGR